MLGLLAHLLLVDLFLLNVINFVDEVDLLFVDLDQLVRLELLFRYDVLLADQLRGHAVAFD